MVYLDDVKDSDTGLFKVTDILGFPVSSIHLDIKRKEGMGSELRIFKNSKQPYAVRFWSFLNDFFLHSANADLFFSINVDHHNKKRIKNGKKATHCLLVS